MEEKERKKRGRNGFFHFKSHFVQSQMTVFKDALSLSLPLSPQDFSLFFFFGQRRRSLMVRYLSRSLLAAPFSLLGPPNRALLFSGVTLFLGAARCFPEPHFELQKKKKKKGKTTLLVYADCHSKVCHQRF